MAVSRTLVVAAVLALVLCLAHATFAAKVSPSAFGTSITIETGTLPESKTIALSRQRDGEWNFDFTAAEEDAFFAAENRETRIWWEWRSHVRSLRAYRQQQEAEAATGTNAGADNGSPEDTAASAAALKDYFNERQVQRRVQSSIRKQSTLNTSAVGGAASARSEARSEIGALWQHLMSAGDSATPTDKAYRDLAERHYPHTYAPSTAPAADGDATPLPDSTPRASLALLRTPIVLDAEVLPHVERELTHLRNLWQQRSTALSGSGDETARTEVEAELRAITDVVSASRALVARVVALADPLADAAASWVAASLLSTHAAVVANDGATEAKQTELKNLLKYRARLVKAKEHLELHRNTLKGVLHRQQLPSAESLLFALELVARQRFGDDVSGTMAVLPLLSTTAPVTGLLEGEMTTHALYPALLCCLTTAAFLWVLEEIKEWCLRRVQASRARAAAVAAAAVGAASGSSRLRKLFIGCCLLQAVVPLLLPTIFLAVHIRGAGEWAAGVGLLLRPSQRVVCIVLVLALTLVNCVWGVMVRRLFRFIDPSVYRRRHAKTK